MGPDRHHYNVIKVDGYCATCGGVRFRSPVCKIEITTHAGEGPIYLVRAQVNIGPPILLYPFSVQEMSPGRRLGCRWQCKPGACSLSSPQPLHTFDEAEALLKFWASGFVARMIAHYKRSRINVMEKDGVAASCNVAPLLPAVAILIGENGCQIDSEA